MENNRNPKAKIFEYLTRSYLNQGTENKVVILGQVMCPNMYSQDGYTYCY